MIKDELAALAKHIGKSIARCRQAKGLTQEQVAERLGIGNEAVSRLERGNVMPTVARLAQLAEIFECNVADLLTESSNRASDQAIYLQELLSKLNVDDRKMVIRIISELASRLGNY